MNLRTFKDVISITTLREMTRTAMPSPISPTACGSRRPKVEHRPRRCAAPRGAQAAGTGDGGQAILVGAPVSTGREAQVTEVGNPPLLRGLASSTWRAP